MIDANEHIPETSPSKNKPQEDLAFEPPKLVVLGSVDEVTAGFSGEEGDGEGQVSP